MSFPLQTTQDIQGERQEDGVEDKSVSQNSEQSDLMMFPPCVLSGIITIHLLEKTCTETFTREYCLQSSVEVMDGWTFLG